LLGIFHLIAKGWFGINLAANRKIRSHQIFNIFFLDLFHETLTSYHIADALSFYLFSAYHKRFFRF
jgi:hypothetical protein